MIPGVRGSLLSIEALERSVPEKLRGSLGEPGRERARRQLHAWHVPLRAILGPASAVRTIFDRLAVPLMTQLGYQILPDGATSAVGDALKARLQLHGQPVATLVVTRWEQDPAVAWRDAVRHGIAHGLRWCLCLTGPALRIVDSVRTYSRQFAELDVDTALDDERTFAVLWGLLRAEAMRPSGDERTPLLDRAVAISEDHRSAVRSSLQLGVQDALVHLTGAFAAASTRRARAAPRRPRTADPFNEALVVIYRVLFLLFAEARGLVPQWHPIYRDGYTIEALRRPVELSTRPTGLWETVQSIARLAHHGCRIGALQVTPFNGRLFSPLESPLADTVPLDDGAVRQALLALTTRPGRSGRERIAYGDLGVEQLGGVYERVLDLDPGSVGGDTARSVTRRRRVTVFARSERRKTTGSFYTPRSLTEYVVRRTLAPLVHEKSPEAILALRILDPAMGSGAFLVAACRYLGAAYETALVRESAFGCDDISETERAGFRRTIAQRCLYGVDVNPMAVQLGRLSLWLATLAADRPLTFLDHRLRAGNSLVGASPDDLARQAPGGRQRRPLAALPLFDDPVRDAAIRDAVATRGAIALEPGDTLAQVRAKEQALARLATTVVIARWKEACDLWCAAWFRDRRLGRPPPVGALIDAVFERATLPPHVAAPLLDDARAIAVRERFFHWSFEFPEVFPFAGEDGAEAPGFDAVIGNPPWEMLRGDRGDESARASARTAASTLTDFARASGVYALQGGGHGNLYQLFLERMLALVRRGGRVGVILPAGILTDHGATALRQTLLDRTAIDTLISFENRDGVFPIHRGLKFVLLAATSGGETPVLPCRFGVRRPDTLDGLPELGVDPDVTAVPRSLVRHTVPEDLAIPDVRCPRDVEILGHVAFTVPALGDPAGWHVRFGRELNATEDRRHFRDTGAGLPVIEGKQVTPFAVDLTRTALRVPEAVAARLIDPDRTFRRARLAYRDVAAPTNRLTLIAALVPPGTLTTHTLFCLKDPLDEQAQQFLCGLFNSFVANYLVRLRVNTHVTTAIVERLPLPRPARTSPAFTKIVALVDVLTGTPGDPTAQAQLQACAAQLYGLDRRQFRHILDTFPLVSTGERDAAFSAFCDIVS